MIETVNRVVPIEAIKPHERNFRRHPESQLAQLQASYRRFTQFRSVITQDMGNGSYRLVAGHGIVEAMRREGVQEVRVDVLPVSLSEEEIAGILIADNLIAQNAIDDEALLAQLLQEQSDAGYDLASLGSDDEALRDMLAKMTPPTLDQLTELYGDEPEEQAFWPVIRVKVSPETKELYDSLMEEAKGKDEGEQFGWLLERVNVAIEDDEEVPV